MTTIERIQLPPSVHGKDINDRRNDPSLLTDIKRAKKSPNQSKNQLEHNEIHNNINKLAANEQELSLSEWAGGLVMTQEEADKISNPEWIYKNLVIQGHLVVIPAEPNGGKTTIFFHIAGEMVKSGYEVIYINADIAGSDAKSMSKQAADNGIKLLVPDFKESSMKRVVEDLKRFNDLGADFNGCVFIFDTLKKMTAVIEKKQSKELYTLLRSMTAKGATIILLAHTNKYKDQDGKPIFEGTGDLRSDVDELIYLIPTKNSDGSMDVSTEPDKVRGAFEPITFHITQDREVSQTGFIDTISENIIKDRLVKDKDCIDAISRGLDGAIKNQKELIDYCKEDGISERIVRNVLKRYSDQYSKPRLWATITGDKNHKNYRKLVGG
ncbi:MAG: hypothetical protein DRQ47_10290 [Gammaproteobacteria bacterium]|nr:MAG: hypothetical protein DRQ47_10290 [Gammaproteobacteria bacterium]